jgi:hypothetical protein
MKKSLLFGVIVLLIGVLITGCPDPVNDPPPPPPGGGGETGEPTQLGANLGIADFKTTLGKAGTYEVPSGGTTVASEAGADTIIVEATTKLKLSDDLILPGGTTIVFKSKDSIIEGAGKIRRVDGGGPNGPPPPIKVVADASKKAIAETSATFIPLFNTGTTLPTGDHIGVIGNLTITADETKAAASATEAAKIKVGDLTATKNLYVLGDLTVDAGVPDTGVSAASIYVTGKITATGEKITTNKLRVSQASTIGTLTPGADGVTIEGIGAVTITNALSITSNLKVTKAKIIGSGGVVIPPTNGALTIPTGGSIAAEADATIVAGTVVSGTTNGVTFTKATLGPGTYTPATDGLRLGTSTTLTVNDGGSVAVAGTGKLIAGTDTNKVTLTKATLGPGTYTTNTPSSPDSELTLGANTTLTVATDGSVAVAGSGKLTLEEETSKLIAGTSPNIVTLTKATLGTGTYTGGTDSLTLSGTNGSVITVKEGGKADVAGTGKLLLTGASDKLVLQTNGTLAVAAGAKIDDANATPAFTSAKLGVYAVGDTSFSTAKATTVAGTGTTSESPHVLTAVSGGTATNIILGLIQFTSATADSTIVSGTDADTAARVGFVKAGQNAVVVFTGSTGS